MRKNRIWGYALFASITLTFLAPLKAQSEGDDTWLRERFAEIERKKRERRNSGQNHTDSQRTFSGLPDWIERFGRDQSQERQSQDCPDCYSRRRPTQESLRPIQEISDRIASRPEEPKRKDWNPLPASSSLRDWYFSENTRGRSEKRQLVPQKDASGNYRVMICAGAGCPMKIPFVFTREMLEEVQSIGARTRQHRACVQDSLRCEIIAAQEMGRQMEMLVVNQKLKKMTFEEMQKAYGSHEPLGGNFERNKQLDLDCVDQSANGSSYFLILKDLGHFKHAEVLKPGYMLPSHWFTRIQGDDGQQYRIDFYHRGRHGVLPGVVRL